MQGNDTNMDSSAQPRTSSINSFLSAVFGPTAWAAHVTRFPDDPSAISPERRAPCWAGDTYGRVAERWSAGGYDQDNLYFTISTFTQEGDRATRRKANFLACHCIVADDVVEKIPEAQARLLPPPSWILQTSPGSQQWGWILEEPETDRARVENLLDGLVARGLAPDGTDPGMRGVTRYVRLPAGVNTKAKYINGSGPPPVRLVEWHPERRVTVEDLAGPFGIDLNARRTDDAETARAVFPADAPVMQTIEVIEQKSESEFLIVCPWVHEHTDGDDSGTWLTTRADGSLGFKCHHGHCQDKTARDFLEETGIRGAHDAWRAFQWRTEVPPGPQGTTGGELTSPLSQQILAQLEGFTRETPAETVRDFLSRLVRISGVDELLIEQALGEIKARTGLGKTELRKTLKHETRAARIEHKREAAAQSMGLDVTRHPMSDFVAFLPTHKYYHLPTMVPWPKETIDSIMEPVAVGPDTEIPASMWLDQNQSAEQTVWAPGYPTIIEGYVARDSTWVVKPGARVINQYIPAPPVAGADPGNVRPWLDHLHALYPDDAEHILRCFAHRVQRPWEKLNHALVLGGGQGIGKDTLLQPLQYAVGGANFKDIPPTAVLGDFNPWVQCVVLRISEARDMGELNRFAFYEHMKTYISAPPDTLTCNEKNQPAFTVFNVMWVVFTTNYKVGGLYLPPGDRRHYVAWSEAPRERFSGDYWRNLWGWYGAGGLANVAAFLGQYDLSGFDPKAPPVETPAFHAMVQVGLSEDDAEVEGLLEAMGTPATVTLEEMKAWCAAHPSHHEVLGLISDRKHRKRIPHWMEGANYTALRNPHSKQGLWMIGGKRSMVYVRVGSDPEVVNADMRRRGGG